MFDDRQHQQQAQQHHPDTAAVLLGSAGSRSCDCEITGSAAGGRAVVSGRSEVWRTDDEAERSPRGTNRRSLVVVVVVALIRETSPAGKAEPRGSVVNEPG